MNLSHVDLVPNRAAGGKRHARRFGARKVAILGALLLTIALPSSEFAWDANAFSPGDEALLVQLTNQARASAGLPALQVDGALTDIARWRSKDMIDRNYFSHQIPPSGTTVFDEMSRRGYCFTVAGENIGTNNFPDDIATQTIHQGFMDSAGHRANIMGNWTVIGVGAYKGADGKHMWTVLFAKKCGGAPPPPPPPPAPKPKPAPPQPVITPAPTQAPTPTPTPVPTEQLDPAELNPRPGDNVSGWHLGGGTPGKGGSGEGTFAAAAGSLRVLDPPTTRGLVDSIVGDVTSPFFGS